MIYMKHGQAVIAFFLLVLQQKAQMLYFGVIENIIPGNIPHFRLMPDFQCMKQQQDEAFINFLIYFLIYPQVLTGMYKVQDHLVFLDLIRIVLIQALYPVCHHFRFVRMGTHIFH